MTEQKPSMRQGMRYEHYLDYVKPFSVDPVPPTANCCGNCALHLPLGKAGFRDLLGNTAPDVINRAYKAADLEAHKSEAAKQRVERLRKFAEGMVYCMAHPPGAGELGPTGLTHRSWWCRAFAAEIEDH